MVATVATRGKGDALRVEATTVAGPSPLDGHLAFPQRSRMNPVLGAAFLQKVFLDVAGRVDGAVLVQKRLQQNVTESFTAVLAIGKVSFPMWNGLQARAHVSKGLLIAPATRFPENVQLSAGVNGLVSDHPNPSERSTAAGEAALQFVRGLTADDRLLVLLSGGGSSLVCGPASGLSLEDKRAAVKSVSRNGASIGELNTVRKHLSCLKGGQLGLATLAPTHVWALSDVVGNDAATIASGPFSPDPTTFAQAEQLLQRFAPDAPAAVLEHVRKGVRGLVRETPKPEDGSLNHVAYEILAGPEMVEHAAREVLNAEGVLAGLLSQNVESDVHVLAQAYIDRALRETTTGGRPRVFVGNGEPSIVVAGTGKGGRATHLALLVAKGISGQPGVAFLAAGTDDRDGSADASGAVVDGNTWELAVSRGLDPEAALANSDSATVLGRLGALVKGPGTSNLLDLHLLSIAPA